MARMLIGGEPVDAGSGKTDEVRNPATGEVVDTVPRGSAQDVQQAVDAAERAFTNGEWPEVSPEDRVSPQLGRARMPTLLLVASTSPPRRLNQKLAYKERIPHAQLHLLDGTHNLQNDLPDQVETLITSFLRDPSP